MTSNLRYTFFPKVNYIDCLQILIEMFHCKKGTIPTKDRVALVLSAPKNIDINDCTYRMLFPHEVQAAMAFESDYIVCGTGKDKVKQLGNAVTPPAMEWLLETVWTRLIKFISSKMKNDGNKLEELYIKLDK